MQKTHARAEDADAAWRLEPHVCRQCFSRLVSRPLAASPVGTRAWHCPNCGADGLGDAPEVLCACGLTLRNPAGGPPLDARVRCQSNPSPTPEFPSLFVAAEVPP